IVQAKMMAEAGSIGSALTLNAARLRFCIAPLVLAPPTDCVARVSTVSGEFSVAAGRSAAIAGAVDGGRSATVQLGAMIVASGSVSPHTSVANKTRCRSDAE